MVAFIFRSTKSDEIYYGGEVRGESAIKKEEEIGSPVIHTYEVGNILIDLLWSPSILKVKSMAQCKIAVSPVH